MAAYSITVSSSLNVFGVAPSNKWGAFNWGAFRWGEGNVDLETRATKQVGGSISLSHGVSKGAYHALSETVTITSDMEDEVLQSGLYTYVFAGNAASGEDRAIPTWTAGTASQPTWATGTVSSTTWS